CRSAAGPCLRTHAGGRSAREPRLRARGLRLRGGGAGLGEVGHRRRRAGGGGGGGGTGLRRGGGRLVLPRARRAGGGPGVLLRDVRAVPGRVCHKPSLLGTRRWHVPCSRCRARWDRTVSTCGSASLTPTRPPKEAFGRWRNGSRSPPGLCRTTSTW